MAEQYKVLYRKYRPTSFDEIIGQSYSIAMLKNAVINNKISHAYIFTGPRGTGKTSTAKIFAKTINCENLKDGIPCGKCNSCININNNADIIEIDAASNNGVDEIRELINNVKIAPSFSKYKVYIIDEVHMLSQSAFNALLLTLEEPPSHVVFILATTNIESVPITILSRCQRYDFKKIDNNELISHLQKICLKEKIDITDDAIEEIVYLSEGGCRDALSILNQLSTSNSSIDLNTVLNNYGSVSIVQIKTIVQCYINNDYEKLKLIFDEIQKSSIDYKVFIKKLVDILFLEAIQIKSSGDDKLYQQIKKSVFELNDLINKININVNPFLLIFLILIDKMDINFTENKEKKKIEEKIEEKENKILDDGEMLENNVKKELKPLNEKYDTYIASLKDIRINNCFAEADKSLLKDFQNKWQKFNDTVDLTNDLKSVIIDSCVVLASKNINIVVNSQESMVDLFNHEFMKIEELYHDILGENIKFVAIAADEWEDMKKEYIKRMKAHYVYQILEEPCFDSEETANDLEKDGIENVLNIFDKEKVEIK